MTQRVGGRHEKQSSPCSQVLRFPYKNACTKITGESTTSPHLKPSNPSFQLFPFFHDSELPLPAVSLIGFPVASFSTEKSCNTQPCGAFAWMFGPWGTCQAGPGGCHNGTQSRLVECVDSDGNSRAPETCSELPAPASSAPCSTLGGYCDPCEGGRACSGHGACDGSGEMRSLPAVAVCF